MIKPDMADHQFGSIALDLGTSSIKAGLLDRRGYLRHVMEKAAPRISASNGRYESDALAYAEAAESALTACLAHCESERPPLGLSCQRSSFLLWEKAGGKPVTPLISWQDNRGTAGCEALRPQEEFIRDHTGLRLAPYYFAPKLQVLLHEKPEWIKALRSGELMVGTLDTYLIWRWSKCVHYVTDASMAARTLLMDVYEGQWSFELCDLFGIPITILPEIRPSLGMGLALSNGLVLQASIGDQSAALIAGIDETKSEALINLGSGGFVVRYLPAGKSSLPGYLHTLVYQDRQTHFAIEGTLNSIATALEICPVNECSAEDLAQQDIFSLAEPSGLGAPYFRDDLGLCFSRPVNQLTPRQIAALLLEAVIFRVARILEEFHAERAIERIYISGGLSSLASLQQGIAQCAPCNIYRLLQKESSLQGAAMLASGAKAVADAEEIEVMDGGGRLKKKYQLWKTWLDAQLAKPI